MSEENKEQKINEFGKPEMSHEATAKALANPPCLKDAIRKTIDMQNDKKRLKAELQKICEIVSPIGKLVYINQSCDIIDVLDKDNKPVSLVKMREAEEGKELILSDISEYGGFLTSTEIDEILNS